MWKKAPYGQPRKEDMREIGLPSFLADQTYYVAWKTQGSVFLSAWRYLTDIVRSNTLLERKEGGRVFSRLNPSKWTFRKKSIFLTHKT